MFVPFFQNLRDSGVPVSLREYLSFLDVLQAELPGYDITAFYYLARTTLVKDERHMDRFDQAFSASFQGLEMVDLNQILEQVDLPQDWLRKMSEKILTDEEKAQIESLGGFDELMKTLRERLEAQKDRHEGGNKWIGTGGTSPFGAYGYNPEGIRIGQNESRHRRAVKVWDQRNFRAYDDTVELGTRNIKLALKRLRRWVRDGAQEELDLPGTIRASAEAGYIDVKTRPEKRNSVKLLLFLDVGGSMDDHIKVVEELFSAAKAEFKHLEHFYFHNCIYDGLWRDPARRWREQISTWDVINTYGSDYKCVIVGDASMSPYEIAVPGGANEVWNEEAEHVWLERIFTKWPDFIWINPVPDTHWQYTQSIEMIRKLAPNRMVPMTLEGLDKGMKTLQ